MDALITGGAVLRGALEVPPDKAICHRAILIAALASGKTILAPRPDAEDCQRTLSVVQALGARVAQDGTGMAIDGCGVEALRVPSEPLSCGESGTTLRLAAGLLAGQPATAILSAAPSLSRRPMRRVVEPLSRMGARFEGRAVPGVSGELAPPLIVHGRRPLLAIRYEMPLVSAQVKSAILLAGLFADGPTTVVERVRTRDHTERMLQRFGIGLRSEGLAVTVQPGLPVSPGRVELPGDLSSAAFFIVGAVCAPGSRLRLSRVGLNPTRTRLLDVLRRMGARIQVAPTDHESEPSGTLEIQAGALRGVEVNGQEAAEMIDELPALMVAAASARGVTRLSGLGELRVKETDRMQSMVSGLQRLGARIRTDGRDTVLIEGGAPLRGASVESAGDHRTAMSLAVAGACAEGRTVIRGAEAVAKSYPRFFEHLALAAGSSTVKTVDNP